ncbi:hypothetical protein BGX34_008573 [Mortierella sp. NVP85]|nr:hypothetical protein BGX34_008573 [Mortierella sp. NVP85]
MQNRVLFNRYADGFQIWDLTHPDNIHEIASVRNVDGVSSEVSFLKVLPSPRVPSGKTDKFESLRPLVAIISSSDTEDGTSASKKLLIYSLATHRIVETVDFGEGSDYDISALDVNERGIVVALTAPGENTRLVLLNQLSMQPLHPKQPFLNDVAYPGVFDLGTRLLAYVTTSEAPTDNPDSKHGEHEVEGGNVYQDLAKGVAKEVFGGVKILGGFAHQTFSSYWSGNSAAPAASTSPPVQPGFSRSPQRHARRASASVDYPDRISNSPHKREAVGTVMVRDIASPGMPVIAHFKPHDHPITGCKFSPSGRLLLTASRQGNVFHIHELRPSVGPGSRHMYKLARGFTHASVEDIVFNEDETWVAVTTSRGTTHLYAINPFGGLPDAGAHMYTGVVNWTAAAIEYPTSLNALNRIKQRHHVPDVILSERILEEFEPQTTLPTERRRGTHRRQNSQDSVSSTGTGTSEQTLAFFNRVQQHFNASGGGRHRAMIAAHFLPSTTVFASDPGDIGQFPDEFDDEGEFFNTEERDPITDERHLSQIANPSALLINRSKAPPVSTAAKLQSTASHLWQTLSPPAAAVVQHAAHGLASIPGLVKETRSRGPVATVRSRTASWGGANINHNSSQSLSHGAGGANGTLGRGMNGRRSIATHGSESSMAVQQELASQGSLSESERGPSFADMYVFNPLGVLTLHRCWISSVKNKKTINGRVMETAELELAPEDVAEWNLNRSGDWSLVKRSLAPPTGRKGAQHGNSKRTSHWNSQGEIKPYNTGINSGWKGQYPILSQFAANVNHGSTITYTQPHNLLWKSNQFTFQKYVGSTEEIQLEFAQGKLPSVQTQTLRRGIQFSTGKDNPLVDAVESDMSPRLSGMPMPSSNDSSRGHGRDVSYEGDSDVLSSDISAAMGSPLPSSANPNRVSAAIGRFSVSSQPDALSFEDAHRIDTGSAPGNSRPGYSGSGTHSTSYQQAFLSTPPAENTFKGRQGFLSGTSPASPSSIPTMTYGNTPISSPSPLASSFGTTAMGPNGYRSGSPGANHYSTNRHSQQMQARGIISQSASPASGSPLTSYGKSTQPVASVSPMMQSTLIMRSPDGDNEVALPGSASQTEDPEQTSPLDQDFMPSRRTPPYEGYSFDGDDDDGIAAPMMDSHEDEKGAIHVIPNGNHRYQPPMKPNHSNMVDQDTISFDDYVDDYGSFV